MAQVLVRNLKSEVIECLKKRARRHGRSLESEVRTILEKTARHDAHDTRAAAAKIRRRLAGMPRLDSAELIREDRAR